MTVMFDHFWLTRDRAQFVGVGEREFAAGIHV
jgi:hypothetical protein